LRVSSENVASAGAGKMLSPASLALEKYLIFAWCFAAPPLSTFFLGKLAFTCEKEALRESYLLSALFAWLIQRARKKSCATPDSAK
jgi:hypothetical protein